MMTLHTDQYDFLREHALPMYELLKGKGIVCEYKMYGSEQDKHMGHVFHLDQRLEEAEVCNDAECAFFDRVLGEQ